MYLKWETLRCSLIIYYINPCKGDSTYDAYVFINIIIGSIPESLDSAQDVPGVGFYIKAYYRDNRVARILEAWRRAKPAFSRRHGRSTTSIRSLSGASRHVSQSRPRPYRAAFSEIDVYRSLEDRTARGKPGYSSESYEFVRRVTSYIQPVDNKNKEQKNL